MGSRFSRHLLGHTAFEEEREFNECCNTNIRLCDDHSSVACRIGKKMTALVEARQSFEATHVFKWCS